MSAPEFTINIASGSLHDGKKIFRAKIMYRGSLCVARSDPVHTRELANLIGAEMIRNPYAFITAKINEEMEELKAADAKRELSDSGEEKPS